MRQQAWNECKTVLRDYPKTDYYLNRIRTEKLFPYTATDDNRGVAKSGYNADGIVNKVISIHDDVLYRRLIFQRDVVENELNNSPAWLADMIRLMYFNREPLALKPASELVGKNWRTAKQHHERFMVRLANNLGIITFEEE
ncbi:hypothetical protein JDW15_04310 [Aerococcaceae bacterium zg-ZJ1578]|uniref:hypothetical protein n=1 Tax=Aerococcaceae bacterium zg-252 TaxID=2796928 RepID=UPI001A33DF17|nr:hypothetical protein [Aerococcaceae bacterium zg-1578]MBR7928398.1 hypothetical protein [Aerococcaceae bacterium zg-ZUI334]MBS4461212.1 hypothetical protein [Aerococcaceae bacterium zg-B36]